MVALQRHGPVTLYDCAPTPANFLEDLTAGLSRSPKEIPCKYFYDAEGSRLFDRICTLDAYYPTRTETAILRQHAAEMAGLIGPDCLLLEFGSGSSVKTRILLDHLAQPAAYVPVDISRAHLLASALALTEAYPDLEVLPVCADYTQSFPLPRGRRPAAKVTAFFPGSTIGNFVPEEAEIFLRRIACLLPPGSGLLIGVDLKKDPVVLHRAYNDPEGVTAAFNRNLLARANRELGAGFALDAFQHHAFYNQAASRIEMHLVSTQDQSVRLGEGAIHFDAGEHITTEYSYKYTPAEFGALAARAGFEVTRVWTDEREWFSVQYLSVPSGAARWR